MTENCPRCGKRLVAGLDGPGTVSCPDLCVVMPLAELEALVATDDVNDRVLAYLAEEEHYGTEPFGDPEGDLQDSEAADAAEVTPGATEADEARAGGGTTYKEAVDERLRLLAL